MGRRSVGVDKNTVAVVAAEAKSLFPDRAGLDPVPDPDPDSTTTPWVLGGTKAPVRNW